MGSNPIAPANRIKNEAIYYPTIKGMPYSLCRGQSENRLV